MFELKKSCADFMVVDGPFAGHKFESGKLYEEIPPQESHKFIEVVEPVEIKPGKKNISANEKDTDPAVEDDNDTNRKGAIPDRAEIKNKTH